ncbi:phasin family protein [Roseovarius arcticus]|uniref:phasin family protein n=1 Tax=Roseovarius arcticus TaxID=2547404 RepID=UPI001110151F|nr:phasin family protein [Roseovarius arcticus]
MKSAKKSAKHANESTNFIVSPIGAIGPIGETMQKVWADLSSETLRFVASRMQQDLEAQKAIAACKDLADMQRVQADFFTQALEQYRSQVSRMMEIISTGAPEGLAGVPLITKREYDDVPL